MAENVLPSLPATARRTRVLYLEHARQCITHFHRTLTPRLAMDVELQCGQALYTAPNNALNTSKMNQHRAKKREKNDCIWYSLITLWWRWQLARAIEIRRVVVGGGLTLYAVPCDRWPTFDPQRLLFHVDRTKDANKNFSLLMQYDKEYIIVNIYMNNASY